MPVRIGQLGPMKGRIKTDLRLPQALMKHVERACHDLGIPKNTLFTMAGCLMLLNLSPMMEGKRREDLVGEIETLFQKVLIAIRNSL